MSENGSRHFVSEQLTSYAFDDFVLYPAERRLERSGTPVLLGGRAFDILLALVERPGEVVTQREFFDRVWPGIHVGAGSIRSNVLNLRKALGDADWDSARYVVNVVGRGYSFAAPVTVTPRRESIIADVSPRHGLPPLLRRMIGRDAVVAEIADRLTSTRFASIVGPGGIGKTTVALAVAHAMADGFEDGVCFVEFSGLNDARLVRSAVAQALNLESRVTDPTSAIVAWLRGRKALLVLDSCEHLITEIAALSEDLYLNAPAVHILATSREPMKAEGECVHRLSTLELPPESASIAAAGARDFSAIDLFLERTAANGVALVLSDAEAMTISQICSRLDGLPLAIEFAASMVSAYGLEGVAAHLDRRFEFLASGRRNAPQRHQTLEATFDWSYALLSETERTVLNSLSILVGPFDIAAAVAVAGGLGVSEPEAVTAVAGLCSKSLIAFSARTEAPYRLLDTTRACALEKLTSSDATEVVAERHASHFSNLLQDIYADLANLFEAGGFSAYRAHLGNVRAALQWCFSPRGAGGLGVRLTSIAGLYLIDLGLVAEALDWSERAVAALDDQLRGTRSEMLLQCGYGFALLLGRGNVEEVRQANLRCIGIAEHLKDHVQQIRVLAAYHIYLTRRMEYRQAMEVAQRALASAEAADDPIASSMADAMLSQSYHYDGDLKNAQKHARLATSRMPLSYAVNPHKYGMDQRMRALSVTVRNLWLLGLPDQAAAACRRVIAFADAQNDPRALVTAYNPVSRVALWLGDLEWAEHVIGRMGAIARKHEILPMPAIASAYEGALKILAGDPDTGLPLLAASIDQLRRARYTRVQHQAALADGLINAGLCDEAAPIIDDALAHVEATDLFVFKSDLLRLKGEVAARTHKSEPEDAAALYRSAILVAKDQQALAWELRAATALAQLYVQQNDPRAAADALLPVYGRFTEGLGTRDLACAAALLESLRSG